MTRYLSLVRKPCSEPPAATFEVPSKANGQMLAPDFTTLPVGNVAVNPTPPLALAVTFSATMKEREVAAVPTTTWT